MAQNYLRTLAFCLVAVLLVGLAACKPKSPEEQVAAQRAFYKVELNAWIVQKEEPADETQGAAIFDDEVAASEEVAADTAEGETAEGEMAEGEMAEPAAEPEMADILFDLAVRFTGKGDRLPGITVDITHADANQQQKAVYRQWIDTSKLVKGDTLQSNFKLSVPLAEGDGFHAEVVPGIPTDLSEYREFSAAAP